MVSRIIRTGELKPVLDWGITSADFRSGTGSAMFNYLLGYFELHKSVPGPNASLDLFHDFRHCDDPGMTTDALCFEIVFRNSKASGGS